MTQYVSIENQKKTCDMTNSINSLQFVRLNEYVLERMLSIYI